MRKYIPAILVCCFFLTGCKDEGVQVEDLVIPDSNVSYQAHIQPVFNSYCTNCHNGQTNEAGLDLTNYAAATSDPGIIFPGQPDNSRLVWAIEGRAGIAFMPPIGSPYPSLSQNHINGIKTWILEGAKSN